MARAKTETAYMLWVLGFLGVCGLHRFYTGQIVLGIVYLCTFGLFGIGQLIDLVLVPGMVKTRNDQLRRKYRHWSVKRRGIETLSCKGFPELTRV